jgi:hypothetical protein
MSKTLIRPVNIDDVEGLLEIELERYPEFYKNKKSIEEVRGRFIQRINNANGWIWLAEREDEPIGWLTSQPTNEEPENFVSWEKSTDNGTLNTTYVEGGKNAYVVNLDVKYSGTKSGAQYLLMSAMGSKAISEGISKVIFQSRMPEFSTYIFNEKKYTKSMWAKLSDVERLEEAIKYSKLRIEKNGKLAPKDKLLRFYENSGFKFIKVVPNSFEDPESLNFGMLCVGRNPVPKYFRFYPVNKLVGFIFGFFARYPSLIDKFIR